MVVVAHQRFLSIPNDLGRLLIDECCTKVCKYDDDLLGFLTDFHDPATYDPTAAAARHI